MSQELKLKYAVQDLSARKIPYDAAALVRLVREGHVGITAGGDVTYTATCDYYMPGCNALPPQPSADASALEKARFQRALLRQLESADLAADEREQARKASADEGKRSLAAIGDVHAEGASHAAKEAFAAALADQIKDLL